MSPAADAAPQSKRARVLRRTAIGLLLALPAVALLVLAQRSESGWIILVPSLALSFLACIELARMGSFARSGWAWVLAPCWLLAASLGLASLEHGQQLRHDDLPIELVVPVLETLAVGLVALIARAAVDLLRAARPIAMAAAGLLALWTTTWGCLSLALDQSYFGLPRFLAGIGPAAIVAWFATLVGPRRSMPSLVLALWLAPWLVLPLPWLWHTWDRFGPEGLVALIVLSKIGDTAGYFAGNAFGKRHPFPRLSPGKTVEGCLASLAAGTLAGGVLVATGTLPHGELGLLGGLLAGAVTNLAAQAGDLLESWLKRRAGVKDSAAWFGPSGGVLDVVDSLLLSVPVSLLLWPWLLG